MLSFNILWTEAKIGGVREWILWSSDFPRYLLPHQMIVTPDQVGSWAPSHHRPSIKRQSLDGQLKHIETLIVIAITRNQILTSKFEYF